MSKKMLLGVLAAVMLSGEISASPVLAQNLYADRDEMCIRDSSLPLGLEMQSLRLLHLLME